LQESDKEVIVEALILQSQTCKLDLFANTQVHRFMRTDLSPDKQFLRGPVFLFLGLGFFAMYLGVFLAGIIGVVCLLVPLAFALEPTAERIPILKDYLGGSPLLLIFLEGGLVGRLVAFFFIEMAITAGLCMTNMGGTGDVAVVFCIQTDSANAVCSAIDQYRRCADNLLVRLTRILSS
jgi:hypothetical protein